MYTAHLTVYRTSLVRRIGGFRSEYDFAQDYDLALRMGDAAREIRHVERILYLWRAVPVSYAAGGKNFALKLAFEALKDWYSRNGFETRSLSECDDSDIRDLWEIRPAIPDFKVSAIISSNDYENVTKCVESLTVNTSYANYEIIVVTDAATADRLSQDFQISKGIRVCLCDDALNLYDKHNRGAALASGDVFCFLGDQIKPLNGDWLEYMLEALIMPEVGAVTSLQLSDESTIYSAGTVSGMPGIQFPLHRGKDFNASKTMFFLANPHFIRDVSVLSGDCLVISKDIFEKMKGFDVMDTPEFLNCMDLSFRLAENGYRCVYTPYAYVLNAGSPCRITEKNDKAFQGFTRRWHGRLVRDACFTNSMKRVYGITSAK